MSLVKGLRVKNIVDVTSKFTSQGISLSKLNAIMVLPYSAALPQEKISSYSSSDEILEKYGESDTYGWSQEYFGVISKNLTKPDQLFIYTYSKTATAATLRSGELPSLTKLKTLNGKFKISMDGNEKEITLNLTTGGINSYIDVATALQTALRAASGAGTEFTTCTCTFNESVQAFIINVGSTGVDSTITFPVAPGSSTDLSTSLGLSEAEGAVIIPGYAATPTIVDALDEIKKANDNYYHIVLNLTISTAESNDELLEVCKWIDFQNDDYMIIYGWNEPKLFKKGSDVAAKYLAYNGIYIDAVKYNYQTALSAGLIAAMDFSIENGNYNINFNSFDKLEPYSVKEQTEFEALKENLSNSLYTTYIKGQSSTMYGRGYIFGTKTSIANVFVCNSYLKFQMEIAGFNLFADSPMISLRGNSGSGAVMTALDNVFQNANLAGILVPSDLTSEEKQKVVQSFGSKSKDAISQLERYGYFISVEGFDLAEQSIKVKTVYLANMPANKLIINNYILGA